VVSEDAISLVMHFKARLLTNRVDTKRSDKLLRCTKAKPSHEHFSAKEDLSASKKEDRGASTQNQRRVQ
jgi:hypothetical protein